MRKELYDYVVSKPDIHRFIREQPTWYKILSRNPQKLQECERESLVYYQKTLPQRIEKVANGVQMASMMYSLFMSMNQK